jgi:hypothetical protein
VAAVGESAPRDSEGDQRRDWSGAGVEVQPASMGKSLRLALSITDIVFLAYWLVSALHLAGVLPIPADWLYADVEDPRVVAWNWSFLPLDLAFSLTGLAAIRCARHGNSLWKPLALISLVLTMVAGGMAVGYWTLLREFDPFWFLPNLALLIWPVFFLGGVVASLR